MTADTWDVAVVGAGPCGSALASLLARAGARVALVDRGRFENRRPGELAAPECKAAIRQLGLEHLLSHPISTETPSVLSIWGGEERVEYDFIRSPHGSAHALDRRAFDQAMAHAAQTAGADLRIGKACIVERGEDGRLALISAGERIGRAGFVAICDGRHSRGSGLGVPRLALNDHVCIAGILDEPLATPAMLVESVPQGWIYALNQPCGSSIIAVNTRRKFAVGGSARESLWREACRHSRLIDAFAPLTREAEIEIWNSAASAATKIGGPDWCLLGDARFASDPLSGQGLKHAFDDALFAAAQILAGTPEMLCGAMREQTLADVKGHADETMRFYGGEQRFRESPFWCGLPTA